ncbi:hypothetical protein HK096_007832, partial [Nowakowskiella sp. JEL0078]
LSQKDDGLKKKLPRFTLFISLFSSIIRAVYLFIDPLFSTGKLNYGTSWFLITAHQPATLMSSVAIGITWYSLNRNIGVDLMKQKFMKVFLLVVGFELATSTMKYLYFPIGITEAIYGVSFALIVLFVEVFVEMQAMTLTKEFSRISESENKNLAFDVDFDKKKFSLKIQLWIGYSIFSATIIIIGWISVALPWFFTPPGFLTSWFLIFFGFNSMTTTQILRFYSLKKTDDQNEKISVNDIDKEGSENPKKSSSTFSDDEEIFYTVKSTQTSRNNEFSSIKTKNRPRLYISTTMVSNHSSNIENTLSETPVNFTPVSQIMEAIEASLDNVSPDGSISSLETISTESSIAGSNYDCEVNPLSMTDISLGSEKPERRSNEIIDIINYE